MEDPLGLVLYVAWTTSANTRTNQTQTAERQNRVIFFSSLICSSRELTIDKKRRAPTPADAWFFSFLYMFFCCCCCFFIGVWKIVQNAGGQTGRLFAPKKKKRKKMFGDAVFSIHSGWTLSLSGPGVVFSFFLFARVRVIRFVCCAHKHLLRFCDFFHSNHRHRRRRCHPISPTPPPAHSIDKPDWMRLEHEFGQGSLGAPLYMHCNDYWLCMEWRPIASYLGSATSHSKLVMWLRRRRTGHEL